MESAYKLCMYQFESFSGVMVCPGRLPFHRVLQLSVLLEKNNQHAVKRLIGNAGISLENKIATIRKINHPSFEFTITSSNKMVFKVAGQPVVWFNFE